MAERSAKGRWAPGKSANPRGRPPGSGETGKLRAAIAARVPELLTAMMARALDGDVGAAKLLLERALPALKAAEQAEAVNLPDGSLSAQGRAIVRAIANGELAPGQGAALLAGLGSLARVTEIDELSARLDKLENLT